MAQEDQTPKCSSSNSGGGGGGGGGGSGGGGRSSKKQKQKKVPQRGLGVAQLEKIRLEEQQKKDAASVVFTAPPPPPPPPPQPPIPPKPSYTTLVPILNYNPSNQSTTSVPYSTDLLSQNSIFRLPQSVEIPSPNTVPLVPGFVNGSKAWNSRDYYDLDKETSSGVDPGLAFRTTSNLPYESSPIWPLPSTIQRAQQYLQPPSMVNSSSSVVNFQIEPPSNQIYYGKYTPVPAMWPEEEKMVGMKRPYPFSMDNPPGPHSFPHKSPAIVHSISSKSDESSNSGTFCFEPGNQSFREGGPPCSAAASSEPDPKKCNKGNGVFNGDFLSLAPPTTTSACPTSNFIYPSAYLASQNHELPDFGLLPYQGNVDDPLLQPRPGRSNQQQQQPYYSFFPPATAQNGQETSTINGDSEVGGSVDLNLKL
ncbi:hypothetical protein HS088_TW21G00416 [Tripterygium wilfordii]|uniref:Uncharacterized protein n=1 Tax=Tripterygium wilfordii TaxID=458696 RepID=A0A7J7C2E4_TRIWF|nr:WAS/WASL-interacting protein family member 1-like isoform X2 [Tripterygium wilfordii]KAF5728271.1 hypothetical protein HS088_TW21G00416 [Tripterygium wilfordii]